MDAWVSRAAVAAGVGTSHTIISLASFATKFAFVLLFGIRYLRPGFIPRESFNDTLQSAVNTTVWPDTWVATGLLTVFFIDRFLASPICSYILQGISLIGPWVRIPASFFAHMPSNDSSVMRILTELFTVSGNFDIRDESSLSFMYTPHEHMKDASKPILGTSVDPVAMDGSSLMEIGYALFRICAPLLPTIVAFSVFKQDERYGRVAVSDLHLPKGIYRSFLVILCIESVGGIASMSSEYLHNLMEAPFLWLIFRYHWNWNWAIVLTGKVLYACAQCIPEVGLLFTILVVCVCCLAAVVVWRTVPRLWSVVLHAILSFGCLLALHRLAFVALARMAAIRAHQFAYALKKVASSVATAYRYAQSKSTGADPAKVETKPRHLHMNTNISNKEASFQALVTPLASRLAPKLAFTRKSSEPNIGSKLAVSHHAEPETDSDTQLSPRRVRAHTKDISAAVLTLSKGIVPSSPLDRLEQFKLATAGERRLRKVSTMVWLVLLVHTVVLALADVYIDSKQNEDELVISSDISIPAKSLSSLWSHSIHLVHVAYMWAFVQDRIQRAEQGLIDAWEEVRLLHCRLATSTISKEEADDWLVYLKARKARHAITWPTRIISALGILRFVLPALLIMDPSTSIKDNILDVLRALAIGGKYVMHRSKQG